MEINWIERGRETPEPSLQLLRVQTRPGLKFFQWIFREKKKPNPTASLIWLGLGLMLSLCKSFGTTRTGWFWGESAHSVNWLGPFVACFLVTTDRNAALHTCRSKSQPPPQHSNPASVIRQNICSVWTNSGVIFGAVLCRARSWTP